MKTTGLTQKQQKALEVLASTGRVTDAAEAAKVSRETVYSWIRTKSIFSITLNQISDHAIEELSNELVRQGTLALKTIEGILADPNSPVNAKLKAADIILGRSIQLRDITNIQRRMALLEVRK